MNLEQKFFIQCISDSLHSRETVVTDNIDWEIIYNYARSQQLTSLIYNQVKTLDIDQNIKRKFMADSSASIFAIANIENSFSKIKDALFLEKIAFVQVKGMEIAGLYPIKQFRTMGDIDLLVKQKDFEAVAEIFLSQKYIYEKQTPHEIVFYKGNIHYEVHEYLVNGESIENEKRRAFYNNYE